MRSATRKMNCTRGRRRMYRSEEEDEDEGEENERRRSTEVKGRRFEPK